MSVATMKTENERFKKAVIISISVHVALFILLLLSPYIPSLKTKRMIHYVNVISLSGGGGGGGGGGPAERVNLESPQQEEMAETVAPKRESLRDLTTPPKAEEQSASTLRHPVEKPERETKPPEDKKAVIQKEQKPASETQTQTTATTSAGTGSGSGIKIGLGSGSGEGFGLGSEFDSQVGLSNFPFSYYIRQLIGKISGSWINTYSRPEKLFTTVFFKIYRNGDIGDMKVIEPSSIQSLDKSAIRAVMTSAPFAPLPQGYGYDYLEIQIIFEHGK